jgi:hypothetical protein
VRAELLPCRSGGPALTGRAPADSRMLFLHMQKREQKINIDGNELWARNHMTGMGRTAFFAIM